MAEENELQEEEPDIFDKIMSIRLFKLFNPFYKKYKEVLLYLFFGGLSFFVNLGTFIFFNLYLNELISNIIAWVITVIFVYLTNGLWVFKSKTNNWKQKVEQVLSFFAGRLGTLFLEEIIIFVFITKLHFHSGVIKAIAQIVVIVVNYIVSKLWVFKKRDQTN